MAIFPSNMVRLHEHDGLEFYPVTQQATRWELFKALFTKDLRLETRARVVVGKISIIEGRPAVLLELHGEVQPEKPSRYVTQRDTGTHEDTKSISTELPVHERAKWDIGNSAQRSLFHNGE